MFKDEIKVIVSDIDGTLINDYNELPHNFHDMMKELEKRNIIFVAASGRGTKSIKDKLQCDSDNLYIISDNGGVIMHKDKVINVNSFSKDDYQKVVDVFRSVDNSYLVASTPDFSYAEIEEGASLHILDEFFVKYKVVDDLNKIDGDFVSISMFNKHNSKENYNKDKIQDLKSDFNVVLAGAEWIDAMVENNNKANAIVKLLDYLDISMDHTIAFGDYHNDLEMLKAVRKGYAMHEAVDAVKEIADEIIGSNNDNSVVKKIYELLEL